MNVRMVEKVVEEDVPVERYSLEAALELLMADGKYKVVSIASSNVALEKSPSRFGYER